MAENEVVFAREAQDQAILDRNQELLADLQSGRPPESRFATGPNLRDDEGSPLLLRKSPLNGPTSRDTSPARASAIKKPWTAFERLPWYKKPSVRGLPCSTRPLAELQGRFSGYSLPSSLPVCPLEDSLSPRRTSYSI